MAKLSVSVPDELWDEARSLAQEGQRPSELIQEALGDWTAQRRRGAVLGEGFVLPQDRLREIAADLGASYEVEFRSGYEDGLEVAKWAGYAAVAEYARFGDWEIAEMWTPDEDIVDDDGSVLVSVWGPVDEFWENVGIIKDEPGRDVYADGADQAFRDLWKTLREGLWRDGETHDDQPGASSEVE